MKIDATDIISNGFTIVSPHLCILTFIYDVPRVLTGAHTLSRKHPLTCWLTCMLSVFGGVLLANFLLGEPILAPLRNNNQILIATAAWYLIFYSPFDVGYKICKLLPVKLVLSLMKEVVRCRKIHDGVAHAAKLYPNSYVVMALVGTAKGNGAAFLKILERLFRGTWTPSAIEFMNLSFPTKASLVASIVFILDRKTELISAPHALVYFGLLIFLVYFKLSSMLLGIHDPFVPFENMFCAIFMGGVWDALSRAISGDKPGENAPAPRMEMGSRNGKSSASSATAAGTSGDAAKKKD
ncbi:TMEM38B [Cordylochernes scorpioides]|uniref:TMEM38B n=1 Tax=Cordylochernes scorpioides TaxID=51811 RepID=A0ABY6KCX3_9ARAC|nr:TMEM38B [Cordylochernes scorpioides]